MSAVLSRLYLSLWAAAVDSEEPHARQYMVLPLALTVHS
jgi:hypothetical protein